jgi:hypothetical protein
VSLFSCDCNCFHSMLLFDVFVTVYSELGIRQAKRPVHSELTSDHNQSPTAWGVIGDRNQMTAWPRDQMTKVFEPRLSLLQGSSGVSEVTTQSIVTYQNSGITDYCSTPSIYTYNFVAPCYHITQCSNGTLC